MTCISTHLGGLWSTALVIIFLLSFAQLTMCQLKSVADTKSATEDGNAAAGPKAKHI